MSPDALAVLGEAELVRNGSYASYVASVETAEAGALTFLEKEKPVKPEDVRAAVVVTTEALAGRVHASTAVLVSKSPRAAFVSMANALVTPRFLEPQEGNIHPTVVLEPDVTLGPGVIIGPNAVIGAGTRIGAGTVIGPGVVLGRRCAIGANVSIAFSLVGDGVKILANASLGQAGFGLAFGSAGAVDVPHFGRVIVQDNVSIGANTCIDRGVFDDTIIGENAKIDNLCQIAHNVQIGAHVVIAAQCGIAGSAVIGDRSVIAGAAGVADHAIIGAGATIGAKAGVMSNIPDGETWGGFPAKPIKTWLRESAWLARQIPARTKSK